MRSKLAYLLIIIGSFGLTAQLVYRLQREKTILATQMQAQQGSLVEGLQIKWQQYLLEHAQAGEFKNFYKLRWNRKGSDLRELFFPLRRTSLLWKVYRNFC